MICSALPLLASIECARGEGERRRFNIDQAKAHCNVFYVTVESILFYSKIYSMLR